MTYNIIINIYVYMYCIYSVYKVDYRERTAPKIYFLEGWSILYTPTPISTVLYSAMQLEQFLRKCRLETRDEDNDLDQIHKCKKVPIISMVILILYNMI